MRVSPVVGWASACPPVVPALTEGVGSALVECTDVDTASRVALLTGPTVVVIHTFGLEIHQA